VWNKTKRPYLVDIKLKKCIDSASILCIYQGHNRYEIVRNLLADGEKTVIYASHLVEELEEIAYYLIWLQKKDDVGREKFFGTVDECRENYRMLEGTEQVLEGITKEYIGGYLYGQEKDRGICGMHGSCFDFH